jgi:hypothetical protein
MRNTAANWLVPVPGSVLLWHLNKKNLCRSYGVTCYVASMIDLIVEQIPFALISITIALLSAFKSFVSKGTNTASHFQISLNPKKTHGNMVIS